MHFPNLSSTLPRKWRLSNSDVSSSGDKKPPKSSSSLRRRFSSLSTSSSGPSSYDGASAQKPPKCSQTPLSSQLVSRSSSFSIRVPSEPKYSQQNTCYRNTSNPSRHNHSKHSGQNGSVFDFKKPLPPPPKSQSNRRSFLSGVLVNKTEASPYSARRSSDTSSLNKRSATTTPPSPQNNEWKSQSLVDLNGNKSDGTQSHSVIAVKSCTQRSDIGLEKNTKSNRFHTFGTPQIKRKNSIPISLSSSMTNSNGSASSNVSHLSISSSQDGINRVGGLSLSQPGISTATIFSKNLRSNSWRNLSLIGKVDSSTSNYEPKDSIGGMNKSHRLSHGAKKVTPPSIPSFNHRGSGSSFGSDYSYEREDSTFSRDPSGASSSIGLQRSNYPKENLNTEKPNEVKNVSNRVNTLSSVDSHTMEDQGIDMTLSPGRDSPGDDSSASIGTVESSSVSSGGVGPGVHHGSHYGGCRNSTTSLDSGRASNTNSAATNSNDGSNSYQLSTFHTIHPIQEHKAMVNVHPPQVPSALMPNRLYSQSSTESTHGSRYPSHGSSFRQSYHSSTSSLGSADRAGEDTICALNIPEMVANGVPDHEILLNWLTDLHYEEYYELFVSAGYDMPTISRMTPEDLTAIGIKKPNHRKRLKSEITLLNIPDGLPSYIPNNLEEWLHCIRLSEYTNQLKHQGYFTIDDVAQISIEDFEDVGLYKLGHQKRLLLAIKRLKELKSGRKLTQFHPPPGSMTQVTASPLPSRSSISQNNAVAGNIYGQYGQFSQHKHLQNLAKPTIPPQVPPVTRQSSTNALNIIPSNQIDNSNKAHSNNVQLHASIENNSNSRILHGDEFTLQPTIHQTNDGIASPKPIYQPEVIRIDCNSSNSMPPAPASLLKSSPHMMYQNVASPAPPPPPPPVRQSSYLTEPTDGGSPPPPSPPMPQPMAPLLSSYSRFQDQQHYLPPQGLGFQTTFQNQYSKDVSNEIQNPQNTSERPWGSASMTRSFDDGDIVQNYYTNTQQRSGNFLPQQGAPGIVRNPNNLALHNSGGGTLPRPKGLVKPRPVAKIAANPQTPLLQKQSMSSMSDLQEDDLCKTSMSSFAPAVDHSLGQPANFEHKYGSQKNLGCYDQGETFANDNVGTIRMRSNSTVLANFSDNSNRCDAMTGSLKSNEKNSAESSQDPTKRSAAEGMVNGQRSAGDVLNDIGSMLSDLTDELDAMLHMERDPLKQ